MRINRDPFERRVKKRLISKQQKGNLLIYNYTHECQWAKAWDKYTRMARGLIMTEDGTIVARPFPKFFNLEEIYGGDSLKGLPDSSFEVAEKMDGSLGILYRTEEGIHISTRGSFESDQALWATRWLREHDEIHKPEYKKDITYLFEIIYPMNRIVVDYKTRAELVLIGLIHNYTGKIYPYNEVKMEAVLKGFSYPKKFELTIPELVKSAKSSPKGMEEEGYVLFYPEKNMQLKIKLRDYVRLHRLTFGITVKSIWENMMFGQNIQEIFADAPDEVMDWIKHWEEKIASDVQVHEAKARLAYHSVKHMPARRDQALWLKEHAPSYLASVFGMIDGRPWKEPLYKMVRPSKEDSNQSFRVLKKEDL